MIGLKPIRITGINATARLQFAARFDNSRMPRCYRGVFGKQPNLNYMRGAYE
jgi:hypothetical protein